MEDQNTQLAPPPQELKVLQRGETPEARIKEEIKKLPIAEAAIAEMAKKCKGLKIRPLPSPDDKEGMKKWREEKEKVRENLAVVRKARTSLEAKRKEVKADYLKIGKGIDEHVANLQKLIEPIESPLDELLDRANKEEEDRKNEAIRLQQEKLQGRVASLLEAGIKFDGSFYSIGHISVDVVTISAMQDERFETLLEGVKTAKAFEVEQERIAAQEEADRRAKEEEDRRILQEQQAQLEKDRLEIQRQKDELAEQQRQAREQVIKNRRSQLEGLGLSWNSLDNKYLAKNGSGAVSVFLHEVTEATEEAWVEMFANVSKLWNEIKDAEVKRLEEVARVELENKKKAEILSSRISFLKGKGFAEASFGLTYAQPNVHPYNLALETIQDLDQEQWNKYLVTIEENIFTINENSNKEARRIYEEGEAARKAKLNESEKLVEYFDVLLAVPRPEIKDPGLNNVLRHFIQTLEGSAEAVAGN